MYHAICLFTFPAFAGYSFWPATEGKLRLSRPGCLVPRRGGLPVQRRSPTWALTVDQPERVTATLNRQPQPAYSHIGPAILTVIQFAPKVKQHDFKTISDLFWKFCDDNCNRFPVVSQTNTSQTNRQRNIGNWKHLTERRRPASGVTQAGNSVICFNQTIGQYYFIDDTVLHSQCCEMRESIIVALLRRYRVRYCADITRLLGCCCRCWWCW